MNTDSAIEFVLVSNVDGLHFEPHRPDGFEFIPSTGLGLRIVLKPRDPESDACGNRLGLECKVFSTLPSTKDGVRFVERFINEHVLDRHADDVVLPFELNGKHLIDACGTFEPTRRPHRNFCPSDVADLIHRAETTLEVETERFLRLIRWRQGIDAPGEMISSKALYWRVGNCDYSIVPQKPPRKGEIEIPGMFGIHWDDAYSADLNASWTKGQQNEPLGHTLLREAVALSSDSPKSSILMIAAALESAVKIHIRRVAPDTAWLMDELPSPPIHKLLRHYIPSIHASRENTIDFWEKLKPTFVAVEKLFKLRNKVAHTGKLSDVHYSITDDLVLVSDLLYIIDFLDGNDWAKALVSRPLRNALGWSSHMDKRLKITLSESY